MEIFCEKLLNVSNKCRPNQKIKIIYNFQVYDILVVNEDYKGDEQGSISLRRGDIVEVINTGASQTENGVSK